MKTDETEYSIAHRNYRAHWYDAIPPNLTGEPDERTTGTLRSCSYCGSMHPADVAAAIRAGATGSWADMKYGWPHKAYFTDIPNPHVGLLEARASANFKSREDWVQISEDNWREPGRPASDTTYGKFYSVHLMDATPEDRAIIESHLGLKFDFSAVGSVSWRAGGKR